MNQAIDQCYFDNETVEELVKSYRRRISKRRKKITENRDLESESKEKVK